MTIKQFQVAIKTPDPLLVALASLSDVPLEKLQVDSDDGWIIWGEIEECSHET